MDYQIIYSSQFADTLDQILINWQELEVDSLTVNRFMSDIFHVTKSLKRFPLRFEDVSKIYGFSRSTRSCLIGKKYAFFYRIDEEMHTVMIGRIYNQSQFELDF